MTQSLNDIVSSDSNALSMPLLSSSVAVFYDDTPFV
jgi:hypothetical protein